MEDTPVLSSSTQSTPHKYPMTPNINNTSTTFQQNSDFLISPNLLSHITSTGELFSEIGSYSIVHSMDVHTCHPQPYSIDGFYRKFLELDNVYLQSSESDPEKPCQENPLFGCCESKQYLKCDNIPTSAAVDRSCLGNFYNEPSDTSIYGLDTQGFYSSPPSQYASNCLPTHPTVNYIAPPASLECTFDCANAPLDMYFNSSTTQTQDDIGYQYQAQQINSRYAHHYDNMENTTSSPHDTSPFCKDTMEYPTSSFDNGNLQTPNKYTRTNIKKSKSETKQKNTRRVRCPMCPMIITKKNLGAHKTTVHDKLKVRHTCPYPNCNKSYSRKNDLEDRHINPFHRGLIHRCKVCSKSFARKDKLTKHAQDSHKNIY